ncbi:MAG: bL21 family ribosomal protein, partial [Chloroflexi bacterium]|nr:bL21 family ribosomal protein [Chloroflexota bacterium]
ATVVANDRGKKIVVFKYKPKVRYRRRLGHRQDFTRLEINEIIA